jgi:hypothetical protein
LTVQPDANCVYLGFFFAIVGQRCQLLRPIPTLRNAVRTWRNQFGLSIATCLAFSHVSLIASANDVMWLKETAHRLASWRDPVVSASF